MIDSNLRRLFSPRSLLAIALTLATLGLGATPLRADAPLTKVSLLIDWYPQAEQGGYFYALVNGLYKKAGLDVTLLPYEPNVSGEGQVALGRVTFMWQTSNQIMTARARGLPIVAVMAAMQHDPKGILLHAESPVHTFADLDGRSIAVAPGSAWFRYIVKKYNLVHARETRLVMNSAFFLHDPTYMQECFVTSEPYAIEQKGEKVRTLLVADSGFDPYRVVATNEAYLNAHKDVVKAFVDASIAGWKDYLVDPATTDAEIKKENKEMTQGQLDYSRNMLKADRIVEGDPAKGEAVGQMNMDRITAQYKILRSLDIIPEFDYKKTFDNEFCAPPAATASATPAPHP